MWPTKSSKTCHEVRELDVSGTESWPLPDYSIQASVKERAPPGYHPTEMVLARFYFALPGFETQIVDAEQ
jgi:hypothetical protein